MKKILIILCALALLAPSCITAFASAGDYNYIYDYAQVLEDDEESLLEDSLATVSLNADAPVIFLTKYGNDSYTAVEYAQSFYEGNASVFNTDSYERGIIFVDDLDNSSLGLYRVGDAEYLIDDDALDNLYSSINSCYFYDDLYYSYSCIASEIEICAYTAFGEESPDSSSDSGEVQPYGEDYDYSAPDSHGAVMTDWAELFTDEQEQTLTQKAEQISETYQMDIVLHTTNSIGNKSVSDYADDFFDYNGYGVGENRSGLLFMLNMNNGEEGNRDYYTSTRGDAITALTDYAILNSNSYINSQVLSYLSSGDYYGAFTKYLELIDIFLAQAQTGEPFDSGNPYKTASDYITAEAVLIFVALIVAFIVTRILKGQMNTAVIKKEATDYIKSGSMNITDSSDMFSHRTVTRTAIPKASSSSSGGSSSHSSSSGASHGGGGGKF